MDRSRYFHLIALSFFLIFASPLSSRAEPRNASRTEVLTLKESLERAFSNNPRLLIVRKDLSIAKSQLRQAKSLFYPRANFQMNYIRYRYETLGLTTEDLGNVLLEAPIATSEGERGNPLAENLYMGRVGFRQTLYSGGKMTYTYKLSKASLKRAESSYENLKQDVGFETARAFYQLLAIKEKETVMTDTLDDIAAMHERVQNPHLRLMIMSRESGLRHRLSELRQQEKNVRFDYLQAMGVELFTNVDVSGQLDTPPFSEDLQTAIVWAKQYRAELRETQIQEELDALSVNLSLAERYPVFLLGGGYEVRNNEFPLINSNWHAGLSMNIPIFDGFSSWARVRESRTRAEQGQLRAVQLEDQVEMEVRSAFNDAAYWKGEAASRENEMGELEKVRARYADVHGGQERVLAALEYIGWRMDAHLNLVESRLQQALASARLSKAIGLALVER